MKKILFCLIAFASTAQAQVLEAPTLTEEEVAKTNYVQMVTFSNRQFVTFAKSYARAFQIFWGQGCAAAQKMADVAGSKAAILFTQSAKTKAYLADMGADTSALTLPCDVVINPDGTATITEKTNEEVKP